MVDSDKMSESLNCFKTFLFNLTLLTMGTWARYQIWRIPSLRLSWVEEPELLGKQRILDLSGAISVKKNKCLVC